MTDRNSQAVRLVEPLHHPVRGTWSLSGDKSLSHRALILGALATSPSHISHLSPAADVACTLDIICRLGAVWQPSGPDSGCLSPWSSSFPADVSGTHVTSLFCGNSGTTMRLLAGVLASRGFSGQLCGDASLSRRPMLRVVEPLRRMGACVATLGEGGRAPLAFGAACGSLAGGCGSSAGSACGTSAGATCGSLVATGQPSRPVAGLLGGEFVLPVASAQVKSCLLLAGLRALGPTLVWEPGPGFSRDHTERLLYHLGVPLTFWRGESGPSGDIVARRELSAEEALEGAPGLSGWRGVAVSACGGAAVAARAVASASDSRDEVTSPMAVSSAGLALPGFSFTVPGDPSSAAFLLTVAGLMPGAHICVKRVSLNPGRMGFYRLLQRMGARVSWRVEGEQLGEPFGTIEAEYSKLHACEVSAADVPQSIDELGLLALVASQAEGVTRLTGAGELRHKESDRLADVTTELRRLGADIEELDDGLIVRGPRVLRGGTVNSHGDHRLEMMLGVAGLLGQGTVRLEDSRWSATSFPEFWDIMAEMSIE